jgi:hypothetical protein
MERSGSGRSYGPEIEHTWPFSVRSLCFYSGMPGATPPSQPPGDRALILACSVRRLRRWWLDVHCPCHVVHLPLRQMAAPRARPPKHCRRPGATAVCEVRPAPDPGGAGGRCGGNSPGSNGRLRLAGGANRTKQARHLTAIDGAPRSRSDHMVLMFSDPGAPSPRP